MPAPADQRAAAEAALARLLRTNALGRVSLAGAYALGFGGLGVAQHGDDGPDWFHELDPLDTLFLGTVWTRSFRDLYEFARRDRMVAADARHAAPAAVERFVDEIVAANETFELQIVDGELMLLAAGRLKAELSWPGNARWRCAARTHGRFARSNRAPPARARLPWSRTSRQLVAATGG